MSVLSLVLAAALLIWLALRGVDIILASLICSLFVALTNQLPVAQAMSEFYVSGPLGAFSFAGKFFLLFTAGAIFGRIMGESQAAASIALALVRVLGRDRVLIIITMAAALLTYGGVVVFVVVFAIYPLGLRLLAECNLPKRLFCAALALGSGTFTLTALPGTPSVQNVISASALGTDLFAAPGLGLIGAAVMLFGGLWYLERERIRALAAGEGFVASPGDPVTAEQHTSPAAPGWVPACVPLLVVLGTILVPRLLAFVEDLPAPLQAVQAFAAAQPIIWPSFALCLGALAAALLFPGARSNTLDIMGRGTRDALMPLLNTASVIGFGGVVTHTPAFASMVELFTGSGLPPLWSMFGSVSLLSAITGSASGGLQIFMQTLAPFYLESGVDPAVLHRVVTIASGGFDSLPHCGAVVAMLTITGITHRQGYRDVAAVTVVFPVLAAITTIVAASFI